MPVRDLPLFRDLRDFLGYVSRDGELVRVSTPVSLVHEMTEIHRRVVGSGGPVLRFEHANNAAGQRATMPVIVNLFGTTARVAAGLGVLPERLPVIGEALAA